MRRRNLVLLAVAIVIGAAAVVRFVRITRSVGSEDFPEGTRWVCLDCGHAFVRTVRQLAEWHREHGDAPLPCPACDSRRTVRAARCPNCGRFVPRHRLRGPKRPVCPHCGSPWPVIAPQNP